MNAKLQKRADLRLMPERVVEGVLELTLLQTARQLLALDVMKGGQGAILAQLSVGGL